MFRSVYTVQADLGKLVLGRALKVTYIKLDCCMKKRNLDREELYLGVKTLIESEYCHIHLHQHKLFTLFSIAFQHFLYLSTKQKGYYLIRIEDGPLAEKLSHKAKDETTRKFIQRLLVSRKLKYGESTFYLDYFHIGSWSLVSDLPKDQIQGALIVKNTIDCPLQEGDPLLTSVLGETPFPQDYYYTSLREFVPRTTVIAFDQEFPGNVKLAIPFIKDNEMKLVSGVTMAEDLDI